MRKIAASVILVVQIFLVLFVLFESRKEPMLMGVSVFPILIAIGAYNVLRGKRSIFDLKEPRERNIVP